MVMYGLEVGGQLLGVNCSGFNDESGDTNWSLDSDMDNVWLVPSRDTAERVAITDQRAVYWGCGNDYSGPSNSFVGKCRVVEVEVTVKG